MIIRTRNQGNLELRSFSLSDMTRWGYDGLRNFGAGAVSQKSAHGIPALYRAARLRSEALGVLRLRCWSGDGAQRTRRDTVWQAGLFAGPANEYQSRFVFWETVGESLAWRNNAYVWMNEDPITGRVVDWYALHPDQVVCKGPDSYQVTVTDGWVDPVGRGRGIYMVTDDTILHIRGHGDGGAWEAPTPIEVFREALAGPILRQKHEVRMWGKGTSLQLGIEFPPGVKQSEAEQWKDTWKSTYEGASGDTTAVIGGGAKIVPIGMTAADSKFVEMAHLTVDDAARIMGVPANLLGAATAGARTIPNLEQDLAAWLRFGLGPELERIESALVASETLFGGAQTYPRFDTETFVRGDVLTEDTIAHQQVQDGRLLVDEWRESKGLPPLPNGAGKIPQIVPVGGGQNPAPQQSSTDTGEGEGESGQRARRADGTPTVNVYVEPILKQPDRKMMVERDGEGYITGASLQDG